MEAHGEAGDRGEGEADVDVEGGCITHLHRSSPAGLSDASGEDLQGEGDDHGARFSFGVSVNHYVGQFEDLDLPSSSRPVLMVIRGRRPRRRGLSGIEDEVADSEPGHRGEGETVDLYGAAHAG